MKITTEPRKLALAMLNEMHATMGTELVYKTKFEKLAIDKIAEKHFAVALQAQALDLDIQAGSIEAVQAANSRLSAQIEAQAKQIEALQADAERYRVGREAAFAGLLVDFPHTKTWSDAMDFAYDQMIANRKGNV